MDAWFDAFEAAGFKVIILSEANLNEVSLLPMRLQRKTVTKYGNNSWAEQVETMIGSKPTAIFSWWGFGSLQRNISIVQWPKSRLLLCVDTYPNASRPTAEIKEYLTALSKVRKVDSFIVTSQQMAQIIKFRFGPLVAKSTFHVVDSPFTLKSHSSLEHGNQIFKNRLIFTGRSDYLYSQDKRMAKDNLAVLLESFIQAGAQVYVTQPINESLNNKLLEIGYSFYPRISREGMTDGTFANLLSSYDGHIVTYATPNSTLVRRISSGLSTRFATALCSPSPILFSKQSLFASEFVEKYTIGFAMKSSAHITLQRLEENHKSMRRIWHENHSNWSGEAFSQELRNAVLGTNN